MARRREAGHSSQMEQGPIFRHLDRLKWETAADQKAEVAALAAQADALGARRSRLTAGEHGFHSHISEMPPGFVVPPHTHDINEIMLILEGSVEVTNGVVLNAGDTAVIPAGHMYGFTAGEQGVRFFVARTGEAATNIK
ncbi:MAG: cupin domain-containing protein [Acidimicrobiaceae bacterium]|nr:cupin domain-containing protein [Acidimicrobiaceae bacterium]MXW60258.1 cupin domain-containing protein [Acidimicrobiaceae bacterium]MXW76193.1 cupin domain-containing protein [Acidimicrobiaceae bacterium]MYC42678.1 cupin domain-containing protein [Acidimicrobiaceae bacterium]MYD07146.1 cupin domain-containing protein [Acidimicrobiaceae bacterium]